MSQSDIEGLVKLRAETARLLTLIEDKRTPDSVRRRAIREVGPQILAALDLALAKLGQLAITRDDALV